MQHGPDRDVEQIAATARAEAAPRSVRVPLLAVHGDDDPIVARVNAVALVRQYLRLNDHPSVANAGDPSALPDADAERTLPLANGRVEVVREWRHAGRLLVRHVAIAGLGHAWSGGDSTPALQRRRSADATVLVGDFFADALS